VPAPNVVEVEPDGRNLRRSHSFERAVDAVLDLIGEGGATPTAQQIAERSGISIRTVFRLTEDIESLHAAAVQRQTERIASLYVTVPADGPLDGRIAALVDNRALVFETIAPVRLIGERLAASSPLIAEGLDRHHRILRAQVESVFAPELSGLSNRDAADALNALDVVSSWESWDQLRRLKGLTRREAARVMGQLIDAVLHQVAHRASA
jgi:TetR/AcrR family transcriptional regulator of autoinduction and epiphytic fitness